MGSKSAAIAAVPRRLIVNADDFGRSRSINEAVIRAHREGILTTASLMVNGAACAEAVSMAKANPGLGVGLHLTFLCGRSALTQAQIPGLVNSRNEFTDKPFKAGVAYYFNHRLRAQLRQEAHEQFKRFRATGLALDHVNGHLHMHLHPVVFRILMDDAAELGIGCVRVTSDPLWLNLRLAKGELLYRLGHSVIFSALAVRARREVQKRGFRHTQRVFGLLQNARVDEDYVHRLLARLPEGDSELYSHPSLDDFDHEFAALISPRVRHQVEAGRIQLIRYQDL